MKFINNSTINMQFLVEVLVEYDYLAKEPDELTIKKGDIIKDVVKKAGGWWEGVLNDKKGMFPDNFVRIINKDAQIHFRNKKDVTRIRQCRVIFSYKQENQDELNLSVGEVITILGEEEEGWWRGTLNGKEGVFPSNFVEEIKSKPGSREDLTNINDNDVKYPTLPPKPAKSLCQVKYSYKAQNEDELTLKEGDFITLLSTDGQDPGWWRGELNGRVGVFPDNFVVIIPELDDKKTKVLEPIGTKVPVVSPQRKSLEEKGDKLDSETKTTPPIPSKKPSVPGKKSPSGSTSQGGLLAGLRKKIVDVVDGASGSKGHPILTKNIELKDDVKNEIPENAFDQVERTAILSDVRANRVKAPGRRPPSVIFKDCEPGIANGNVDHSPLDNLSEQTVLTRSAGNGEQEIELKPKVREWEKHKAPWLEEMKLSQAKRTSLPLGPEQNKLKLTPTPTEKCPLSDIDDNKSNKVSPVEKVPVSPADITKPTSSNNKLKTSPTELEKGVALRSKPSAVVPQSIPRPQTVHNLPDTMIHKMKTSQVQPQKEINLENNDLIEISTKQYSDLLQRLEKLETFVQQQHQDYKIAIEELKGKLQIETDMRRLLQAELDKISQCVMQV
ncbi:hypothetical protein FQR65_LT07056 [Abscondita terminalis]|nr:hypothetical protein FQR65_LT07056 [Abscondita terminalis]